MPFFPDEHRHLPDSDPRRVAWTPADRARAEALVAQHGGILETRVVPSQRIVMEWLHPTGASVTVEGPDVPETLQALTQHLATDTVTYLH